MPTLGTDCDIILQHASVNGGVGYGFLLVRYADKNQTVKVERWAYLDLTSAYVDQVKVCCRLYLRDGAKGPNGKVRSESRAVEYERLLSLLAATNRADAANADRGVHGFARHVAMHR